MPGSTSLQRLAIIIFILGSVTFARGQTVVNTTGNTIKDNSCYFEYSIGEIAITTISNNNKSITQGLLQPGLKEFQAHAFFNRDLLFEKVTQRIFKKSKLTTKMINDKLRYTNYQVFKNHYSFNNKAL